MPVPTVVVIGGSFAGYTVCQNLDKTLKTKANIILIEEREAFYLQVAGLRSVVEGEFAQHTWISYSNLFQFNTASKVVKAKATSLNDKQVFLSTGEKIDFDYLVIATGSRIPSPGGTLATTKKEYIRESEEIREAIAKAGSIAIIGGGTVGIELAGEIATDFPGKQITLLHSGTTLLDRANATASTLKQQHQMPMDILTTINGEKIESDIQFLTTGIQQPNSEFAASYLPLDSRGYIQVEVTGQVKGHRNIFSLGDVSNLDPVKLAYIAFSVQAPLVSGNIISLMNNGSTSLKEYKKAVPGHVVIITIGRKGGIMQTPFGTFGSWLAVLIKSRGLFTKSKHAELKQELKYTPPY
ncbi:UNVERIFIED_CONTAM: hypothetical protein HDU68_010946 [Siphonaria sp. JEL0065]|nr:hypothetical protein HDU68_010946 [Siphonaria sp. JEL0065]